MAPRPANDRVGLVTVSGGVGVLMADAAADYGLDVAAMPQPPQDKIKKLVPFAATRNPIDITGQVVNDFSLLGQAIEIIAAEGGYGSIVPFIGSSARVPESMRTIKKMIEQVQTLAFELRPSTLDEFGLVGALRLLAARHGDRTGVRASFAATPTDVRAPVEIETASFRIAQEALSNVARHARAHHIEVTLTAQDVALEVTVRDDGVGFNVERLRTGLGLVGMGERAELAGGGLDIQSAPGAGTIVRARFPLPSPESVAGTDQ